MEQQKPQESNEYAEMINNYYEARNEAAGGQHTTQDAFEEKYKPTRVSISNLDATRFNEDMPLKFNPHPQGTMMEIKVNGTSYILPHQGAPVELLPEGLRKITGWNTEKPTPIVAKTINDELIFERQNSIKSSANKPDQVSEQITADHESITQQLSAIRQEVENLIAKNDNEVAKNDSKDKEIERWNEDAEKIIREVEEKIAEHLKILTAKENALAVKDAVLQKQEKEINEFLPEIKKFEDKISIIYEIINVLEDTEEVKVAKQAMKIAYEEELKNAPEGEVNPSFEEYWDENGLEFLLEILKENLIKLK